jgi:exodeoxyribonuclease VII small subunit
MDGAGWTDLRRERRRARVDARDALRHRCRLIPPPACGSFRAMPQATSDTSPAPNPSAAAASEPSRVAEFEQSLDELEQLVQRMERGDLSLDDSLKTYERGIALYRNCQAALEQAELRVKLLYDPESPDDAEDFKPDTP